MKYYSLNNTQNTATFKEAVVNGIAPDKGLYFPTKIPVLSKEVLQNYSSLSKNELAYALIKDFIEPEIPTKKLQEIIAETLNFPFPLVQLNNKSFILELFHGPTLAFKDVGARFMARCLGYFNSNNKQKVTVLVATSGDTGGAVADGFYNVEGVDVIILYPKGRVSAVQEKQLTTLGNNIKAIEVEGSFDDCQSMVKTAFLDKEITTKIKLTSANSINVARWLPQMLYYAFALQEIKEDVVFSVPSGNFGNICAAFMLKKMGMPIHRLIAACNANDTIPQYLATGTMQQKHAVATISNAMDVAIPSNFVRIMALYKNNLEALNKDIRAYSFSDHATQNIMKETYKKYNYILDPHGAVALLGAYWYKELHPYSCVVALETAHPCKFLDVVEATLNNKTEVPQSIKNILNKSMQKDSIKSYDELKQVLIS